MGVAQSCDQKKRSPGEKGKQQYQPICGQNTAGLPSMNGTKIEKTNVGDGTKSRRRPNCKERFEKSIPTGGRARRSREKKKRNEVSAIHRHSGSTTELQLEGGIADKAKVREK